MADRLFQPIDIFGIERAAPRQCFINRECLVVVDHQFHAITYAFAHGMNSGDILGQGRITETQLDRAETAREQFLRFVGERGAVVHQTKPATVVSRNWSWLGAQQFRERDIAGNRQGIPACSIEASHRHAHDALNADQRETLRELCP